MAFVIRSPKVSQFDFLLQQSHQPNHQHDKHIYVNDISLPDQRIHSNVSVFQGQDKGVVKDGKNRQKGQDKGKGKWRGRGGRSQPLIQCGQMMFEGSIVEQNRKKICYNFKNIKKVVYQRCPSQEGETQKQPSQFYTLPGSLKSKTMVKYTSKVGNKNAIISQSSKLPGPGSYTPNIPQKYIHTLPFHKSKSSLNINDNHYLLETNLRQKKCQSKYDEQIRKRNRKNNQEYSFSTADDDEGDRKNGFCLGQGKLVNGCEGFFYVKYQMMNSKVFRKRGLGAVAASNRLLMNKILCKDKQNVVKQGSIVSKNVKSQQNKQSSQPLQQLYKQQSSWNQSCQKQQKIEQQSQYQILEQKHPGPASYKPIPNPASPSSPTFSKSPRFPHKPTTQATFLDAASQQDPTLYNQTQIENKEQRQSLTSNFASGTRRFEDNLNSYCKQPDWDYIHRPLQYQSNDVQMTKQSYNKKYHGFEAGVYRSCQKQNIDTRPYYDVNGFNKKQILGNFTNSTQKRELFSIDQDDGPGPQKYNTCPSWHKQHSCLLKPDPKQPKTRPTPCTPPPNFSLRSYNSEQKKPKQDHHQHQPLLKQHNRNNNLSLNTCNSGSNLPGIVIPSVHQRNVSENIQQVILPDRYCSHQIWESKSFNVHFSGELVKANHMCKNYLIA